MHPLKVPLNLLLLFLALTLSACDMFIPVPMPAPSPIPPFRPSATPTATPLPTRTPFPTATSSPTPYFTATPLPCDKAGLVADVTFPPGILIAPGTQFTKTWRIRNDSSCTWTPGYWLVNAGGDALGGPVSMRIPYLVFPGGEFNISVDLFAPCSTGHYFNNWMLRDTNGIDFGVGENYTAPLLVLIAVAGRPVKLACTRPHSLN